MKQLYFYFSFLLVFLSTTHIDPILVSSKMEEICDNRIDDDLDGLIDLNDSDCSCQNITQVGSQILDYIPNPSFGDFPECNNEIFGAIGGSAIAPPNWVAALTETIDGNTSTPTPDHFNTLCDNRIFLMNFSVPPPRDGDEDGNGYFGFFDLSDPGFLEGKEYFGTCLTSSLERGSVYLLDIDIGFADSNPTQLINFGIYGTPDCNQLPIPSDGGCPDGNGDWVTLAEVAVGGSDEWITTTFRIEPTVDINAIVMGPGCAISDVDGYYFMDNLRLRVEESICEALVTPIIDCEEVILQAANIEEDCRYQWYQDGLALVGEVSDQLILNNSPIGNYQVVTFKDGQCSQGMPFTYDPANYAIPETMAFESICEGDTYEIGDQSFNITGTYDILLQTIDGCDSLVVLELMVTNSSQNSACSCQGITQEESQSINPIPNPSFENFPFCRGLASSWVYATTESGAVVPSPDLFNITCASFGAERTNLPQPTDGNGYFGFENSSLGQDLFKEYYGTCLTSSLKKDSIYLLDIDIGFYNTNPNRDYTTTNTFGVFGTSNCNQLPTDSNGGCPSENDNWVTLSDKTVSGNEEWITTTFRLEPTMDINAIAIGPGCKVLDFANEERYYFMDNLRIRLVKEERNICEALINPIINCEEVILQAADIEEGCRYQWYRDNVELPEEISSQLILNDALAGDYQLFIFRGNQCDSSSTFFYNPDSIPKTRIVESICEGTAYEINNQSFDTEGSYEISLTSAAGCDSLVVLELSVVEVFEESITAEICQGDTYEIGDQSFDTGGSYEISLIAATGCDSLVVLALSVVDVLEENITAEICQGDTYELNDQSFDTEGRYEIPLTSATGCDSLVVLELSILEVFEESITAEICQGDTYEIGDQSFDTAGSYEISLTSANGCDSLIVLALSVLEVSEESITAEICQGDTYELNDQSFDTGGRYEVSLTSANGCDSLIVLALSVLEVFEESITAEICQGTAYEIGDQSFDTEGRYEISLTATNGCDSLVVLALSVVDVLEENITAEICQGDTYEIGDQSFNTEGRYEVSLTSSTGCDSLVILALSVVDVLEESITAEICQGDTYEIGDQSFDTAGRYEISLTATAGCDSLVVLELSIVEGLEERIDVEICQGDTYEIGDQSFDAGGRYEISLTAANGCDSLIVLALSVIESLEERITAEICQGDTYEIGDQSFNAAGIYEISLEASNGCDSLVILTLQIDLTEGVCSCSGIVQEGAQPLDYIPNPSFEDFSECVQALENIETVLEWEAATVISILNVFSITSPDYTNISCNINSGIPRPPTPPDGNGYIGFANEVLLNEIYKEYIGTCLTSSLERGKVYFLDVDIGFAQPSSLYPNPPISFGIYGTPNCNELPTTVTSTACPEGSDNWITLAERTVSGENEWITTTFRIEPTVDINAITIGPGCARPNAAGYYYIDNLRLRTQENVCEALITPIINCEEVILQAADIGEGCRYQWYRDDMELLEETSNQLTLLDKPVGNYQLTVFKDDQCDQSVSFEYDPTNLEVLEERIDAEICQGDTYEIGDQSFDMEGRYEISLTAAAGCDSLVILTLSIVDVLEENIDVEICQGDTYEINDQSFDAGGRYEISLTSTAGCDSLVILALSIVDVLEENITAEICQGDTYEIGDQSFDTEGRYEISLTATAGCDSLVVLALSVVDVLEENIDAEICQGATYEIGDQSFDTAGSYEIPLTSSAGCDSLVVLALSVVDVLEERIDAEICQGATYEIGDQSFDTAGSYEIPLTSSAGCDSLVILALSVVDVLEENIDAEICQGATYEIGDQSFDTEGRYEISLTATAGCDSLVVLALSVVDVLEENIDAEICQGATYEIGDQSFDTEGSYEIPLTSSAGCDSLVVLALSVVDVLEERIDAEICQGATYEIGNQSFDTAGSYEIPLIASAGCDSLVILALSVVDVLEERITAEICEGDTYQINGQSFDTGGRYEISLTSSTGCDSLVVLELTILEKTTELVINSSNATPSFRETVRLELDLTNISAPYTIKWEGINLSCDTCTTAIVQTELGTSTYSAQVIDANGCQYEASTSLFVAIESFIYTPTAFTPNGDGINDSFIPYSEAFDNIELFQIFDRWGERVYSAQNISFNNEQAGWDGNFNNTALNPGIFVYMLIYTDQSGREQVLSGEIALLR